MKLLRCLLAVALACGVRPALAVDYFGYLIGSVKDSAAYDPADVNIMEVDQSDYASMRKNGERGISSLVVNWFPEYLMPKPSCQALPDTTRFDDWVKDLKRRNLAQYVAAMYLDEPYFSLYTTTREGSPACADPAAPNAPSYPAIGRYLQLVIDHVRKEFLPYKPAIALIEAKPALESASLVRFAANADWIGFDWYPSRTHFTKAYDADLATLLGKMDLSHQKVILVPQASTHSRARPVLDESDTLALTDEFLALLSPTHVPDISRHTVAVLPFFGGAATTFVEGRGTRTETTWSGALRFGSVEQRYRGFARAGVPAIARSVAAAAAASGTSSPTR